MTEIFNRTRMTTATTGTGTITLGSAVSRFATFAEVGVSDGDVVPYTIEDGDDYENGLGTYTASGTTLSRDTVRDSKISGTHGTSKINLSGGALVFISAHAEDLVIYDQNENITPPTDDGGALGTTSRRFSDLFLASGAVINFDDGDITFTHSSGGVDLAGGVFRFPNSGLQIYDTGSDHVLTIQPGTDLSTSRTLTLTTGDADRTLTLSANVTLDQNLRTTDGPQFSTIELGTSPDTATIQVTGSIASSITLTLPGVTGSLLSNSSPDTLGAGFAHTVDNDGTQSSGTYTPDQDGGNMKRIVNGGAFTLAPPTDDCCIIVQITNNASAGAITTSGFSGVFGDDFTTTNGDDFICTIIKINGFSTLTVQDVS